MGDIGKTQRKRTLIPEEEPGKRTEETPEPVQQPEPQKVPVPA